MDIATSTSPSDESNDPQKQLTKFPPTKDLVKSKELLDDLTTALKTYVKYDQKYQRYMGWGKTAEKLFDGDWKDKFHKPNSPIPILRSRVLGLHGLFTTDCLNHDKLCKWLNEWKGDQRTNDESRKQTTSPSDESNNPQKQLTAFPPTKDLVKSKELLDGLTTALKTYVKYDQKSHVCMGWGKAAEKLFDGDWKDKFHKPRDSDNILSSRLQTLHVLSVKGHLKHDELCKWLKEWKEDQCNNEKWKECEAKQNTNENAPLEAWFDANVHYPFPDAETTKSLSEKTGKTPKQVMSWCSRKRTRSGNKVKYSPPLKKENAPLKAWYDAHLHNPHPNEETVASLAKKTEQSERKVRIWFSRKRTETFNKVQKEYVFYLFGIKTTLTKEKLQVIETNGFSFDKYVVRTILSMLGKKKEALMDERVVQLYNIIFDWNLHGNSTLDDELMKRMKEQINKNGKNSH